MYCGKCGEKNLDDAVFCKRCGAPLLCFEKVPVPQARTVNRNRMIGIMCVAVIAAIIAIVVLLIFIVFRPSANLGKYLQIEATGYDGYGYLSYSVDWDAVEEKLGDRLKISDFGEEWMDDTGMTMTALECLMDAVEIVPDKTSALSNGDVVSYKIVVDEDILAYTNVHLRYNDGTYTVEGLEQAETFDIFSGLNVTFSGISPDGQAEMSYESDELAFGGVYLDAESGLRNGDTVTAYISENDPVYWIDSYGKIPESFEKSYTVSGLAEYIDSFADLPENFEEDHRTDIEDMIYAYAANNYDDDVSLLGELEYEGYIFLNIKDASVDADCHNALYLIYSGEVSYDAAELSSSAKIYYPIIFSNIILSDGTVTYDGDVQITGGSRINDTEYDLISTASYTEGYDNPLTCYTEIVESNRDTYSSEIGDGFEIYESYDTITSISDINDDYRGMLQADASERIKTYAAKYRTNEIFKSDEWSNVSTTFVGEYFLVAKGQGSNADFADDNVYYAVYKVSYTDGVGNAYNVYWPVKYTGIVKLPDGTYLVTRYEYTYDTDSYEDEEEMFSDLVTSQRGEFDYEVTGNLTQFGS